MGVAIEKDETGGLLELIILMCCTFVRVTAVNSDPVYLLRKQRLFFLTVSLRHVADKSCFTSVSPVTKDE